MSNGPPSRVQWYCCVAGVRHLVQQVGVEQVRAAHLVPGVGELARLRVAEVPGVVADRDAVGAGHALRRRRARVRATGQVGQPVVVGQVLLRDAIEHVPDAVERRRLERARARVRRVLAGPGEVVAAVEHRHLHGHVGAGEEQQPQRDAVRCGHLRAERQRVDEAVGLARGLQRREEAAGRDRGDRAQDRGDVARVREHPLEEVRVGRDDVVALAGVGEQRRERGGADAGAGLEGGERGRVADHLGDVLGAGRADQPVGDRCVDVAGLVRVLDPGERVLERHQVAELGQHLGHLRAVEGAGDVAHHRRVLRDEVGLAVAQLGDQHEAAVLVDERVVELVAELDQRAPAVRGDRGVHVLRAAGGDGGLDRRARPAGVGRGLLLRPQRLAAGDPVDRAGRARVEADLVQAPAVGRVRRGDEQLLELRADLRVAGDRVEQRGELPAGLDRGQRRRGVVGRDPLDERRRPGPLPDPRHAALGREPAADGRRVGRRRQAERVAAPRRSGRVAHLRPADQLGDRGRVRPVEQAREHGLVDVAERAGAREPVQLPLDRHGHVLDRTRHLADVERVGHLLQHRGVAADQRALALAELAEQLQALVLVDERVVELVAELGQRAVGRHRRGRRGVRGGAGRAGDERAEGGVAERRREQARLGGRAQQRGGRGGVADRGGRGALGRRLPRLEILAHVGHVPTQPESVTCAQVRSGNRSFQPRYRRETRSATIAAAGSRRRTEPTPCPA